MIYIAFGLQFIFEKRTQQITTYLSKILQVKLKKTLEFFRETGAWCFVALACNLHELANQNPNFYQNIMWLFNAWNVSILCL